MTREQYANLSPAERKDFLGAMSAEEIQTFLHSPVHGEKQFEDSLKPPPEELPVEEAKTNNVAAYSKKQLSKEGSYVAWGIIIITIFLASIAILANKRDSIKSGTEDDTNSSLSQKANLSIQVAVKFKNGDVKPITKCGFAICTTSLRALILETSFSEGNNPVGSFFSFEQNSSVYDAQKINDGRQIVNKMKASIVGALMTDFSGKASTTGIKPGFYFLVGETRDVGNAGILWDMPITLSVGDNTLLIDQSDAAYVY